MKLPNNSLNDFIRIRRQDRAIQDPAWIREFLRSAPYGTLATVWEDQPFLKPSLFVYDEEENVIYLHSALEGRMRTNIETNHRVCFCVSQMGRLLPATTAMEFGVEYESVVVFGRVIILENPVEARHGLQQLLDKYFPHLRPGVDYRPIIEEELNITSVYRIEIDGWSGKADKAEPEFPGAFFYGQISQ